MGDEPEITQVENVPSETLPLDKTLNSKCHDNVEVKNKDGQKNKRQHSPKKKKRGLERENTLHPRMNQIVIVTKIYHQRTQILTMTHHQNLQRKKCPRMSIPDQGSLPSLQRKIINGNLANNTPFPNSMT